MNPIEDPILSSDYETELEWRLEERIKTIYVDPTSPKRGILKTLVKDIRSLSRAWEQLDTADKNLDPFYKIFFESSLSSFIASLTRDDDPIEEESAYHKYAVAGEEVANLHDQIRGNFRELGLGWYLRDQDNTKIWFEPTTIFSDAMDRIDKLCTDFEL
ncbi:MAG: hypothetical protein ABI758_01440 [Candidatus Woesebacteria bacterium]